MSVDYRLTAVSPPPHTHTDTDLIICCRPVLSLWPSGKPPASIAGDPRIVPPVIPGGITPVTLTLKLLGVKLVRCDWESNLSGVTRSELGLVGRVSLCSDWVGRRAGSATSISAWQHVQQSVQIRS